MRYKILRLSESDKIGDILKKRRHDLGYSQSMVAEMSGVSYGMVSMIESNLNVPSIRILSAMCKALGITEIRVKVGELE